MMPRIRSVKPELFTHERLFEAESDYKLPLRLAFIALFTQCDQWGRFRWQPKRLKLSILPYDEIDIVQVFEALAKRGFIEKYEVQGDWYGRIPSWANHQRITSPEHPSGIPSPEGFVPNKSTKKNNPKDKKKIQPVSQLCEELYSAIPLEEALPTSIPPEVMLSSRVPTENEPECNTVGNDRNLIYKEDVRVRHTVDTECHLIDTKDVLACNKVDTEHHFVHTEDVLMCNSVCTEDVLVCNAVCTEYANERTLCMRNREYGNGVGNREYGNGVGNNTLVASETRPHSVFNTEPILKIFKHWQTVMKHPNTKLDPKRKVCIGKALDWGYSVDELCEAITGCSITPHNQGQNDRGQRYDGLCLILRDSDQIDRFRSNYHCPPHLLTEGNRKTQANVQSLQRWMNQKMQEEYRDANTR
jgi:hypothetical protein